MTAIEYRLGQAPALDAASADGLGQDSFAAAKRRLTLAALWFAGLVAWGIFSYLTTDLPGERPGSAPARAEQPFDGHGKWTGY